MPRSEPRGGQFGEWEQLRQGPIAKPDGDAAFRAYRVFNARKIRYLKGVRTPRHGSFLKALLA